jgi:type IV pilus assembly protein PilQ
MNRFISHGPATALNQRRSILALLCVVGFFGAASAAAADAPAATAAAAANAPAASEAPAATAAPSTPVAGARKLQSIDVKTLSSSQLQLTLHLSGPAPEPLAFTIAKPARISLDLPDTGLALPEHRIDVGTGGVDTVLAAEANGRTRIVLDLDQQLPYETHLSGNDIVLLIGAPSMAQQAKASGGVAPTMVKTLAGGAASVSNARAIKSIDFRRAETGAGRLIVRLSDPRTPISVSQQGSQVIVDFSGTDLPKALTRRYDTLDFGTPVVSFEVARVNYNDARIVLNASGDFSQLAYQTDNEYVVEISPARKVIAAGPREEHKEYKGERLTLNFQDIETRAVLQLLADASGQNIVVSDSVNGSVTLRLQNVPWDQALDIVLRTKGLDKRQEGNVIIVGPAEELSSREKADLAAKKDIQELEPLRTEYLQVNYAKASDIAILLRGGTAGVSGAGGSSGAASSGSGGGHMTLLSQRGSVSVDGRTNTLLISDTSDRIADIRRLVAALDIPIKQVLIESRIVIVNDDFERDLGTVLGLTAAGTAGNNGLLETTGTAAGTDQGLSSAISNLASSGSPLPVSVPTGSNADNRYNVNLPPANTAGSIAFLGLTKNFIVDLELSAAQIEGRGQVISSPRVITANQKEADIEQGVEIPYQASASSGATTIQFEKAVLALKVTPLITPDNRIILDLNVSDDSVGKTIVASGGVNVPAINTQSVTTQVLVDDGETVVLGGILTTTETDNETKVPILGDIPVLGNFFKSSQKINNKDELMIFVTPKIVREGTAVAQ